MSLVEKNTTHFDNLTGEITLSQTITEYEQRIPNEPPYIKLYTTDLSNLFKLPAGTTSVLICFVTIANYQGVIALNKYLKDSIAERMNAKPAKNGKPSNSVVNKAITELLNKGIISRIGSSTYQLNPNYFARGRWRDIYEKRRDFKMTITYKNNGKGGIREIVTEQLGADIVQLHP
jgi:predicted transcriptional regulator